MKCYKILHIPTDKFLSKQRNPVRYYLTNKGTTWKVKIDLQIFINHFDIKDLKYVEV